MKHEYKHASARVRQSSLTDEILWKQDWEAAAKQAREGRDSQPLTDFAARMLAEAQALQRRLRKQNYDFSTLLEIVGQVSARSLDVSAMQTYLLRTVAGHFTTPRLLILRKPTEESRELSVAAVQGPLADDLAIALESQFCQEALARKFSFFLKDLPRDCQALPEAALLARLGLELAVPLIQEVDTPVPVLEGLFFLGPRLAQRAYSPSDLDFLNALGRMLAICLRNEALYRRSIIDDLTGVASRGHFEARLAQELNRVRIYGHRSLGLVMLDVDNFKQCNDRYGHPTGDLVLRMLADTLVAQVRNVDLVARYGGEEFMVLLLEIDRSRAQEIAERLRAAIEHMHVKSAEGQILRVTASFGVAAFPDDADERGELLQKVDDALYRAKHAGRNRVAACPPREKQPKGSAAETSAVLGRARSSKFDRRGAGEASRSPPPPPPKTPPA